MSYEIVLHDQIQWMFLEAKLSLINYHHVQVFHAEETLREQSLSFLSDSEKYVVLCKKLFKFLLI